MNKKFKNFFLASIEIERKKRQSKLILNKNKLLKDTKEYTKINDSVLKNIQKRHENYMKSIGR